MLRANNNRPPELKSAREIALMRESGKLVARALKICRDLAKPGTKTIEIGTARPGIIVALSLRRNRKITSRTSTSAIIM